MADVVAFSLKRTYNGLANSDMSYEEFYNVSAVYRGFILDCYSLNCSDAPIGFQMRKHNASEPDSACYFADKKRQAALNDAPSVCLSECHYFICNS